MTHPRDYDYSKPTLTADLVMKGGITSGVVYPWAACELARTYEFRNVGGTSAGAIAAALTAAAECGRQNDFKEGFSELAELPEWLGSEEHLLKTFQPQAPTERLFKVFRAGIGGDRRGLRVFKAALRHYPMPAAIGAAPGLATTGLAVSDGGGIRLLAPLAITLGGGVAGIGVSMYRTITRGLPDNFFGLCTGMDGAEKTDHPAVTPWLTEMINRVAGRDPGGDPLTFGDLKNSGVNRVNLEMVTTSLSNGRPFRLPFREPKRAFFFDPGDMRRLFPERVVNWMVDHPAPADGDFAELVRKLIDPRLRPMPDENHLPVIVATRMSLSFPGLISAVPLCAIDWMRDANAEAKRVWLKWLRDHKERRPEGDPATWDGAPRRKPTAERCWFSDGGIVSNFPVHFFDSPLPRRPTFAINLRPFPEDKPEPSENEHDNVWLAPTEEAGSSDWWYPRWEDKGYKPLWGFARMILDTLQNWSDNAQIRVPGYRDRVVHVNHTKKEGGINLNMEEKTVIALSTRGRCAGEKLAERFSRPARPDQPSWDSHRWLRFRSTMSLLETALKQMGDSWNTSPPATIETSYPDLADRPLGDPPKNHPWKDDTQRQQAIRAKDELLALIQSYEADGEVFHQGAPEPEPQLRIMPHW
jgi:predicted acylesterase/phospholipase RssA